MIVSFFPSKRCVKIESEPKRKSLKSGNYRKSCWCRPCANFGCIQQIGRDNENLGVPVTITSLKTFGLIGTQMENVKGQLTSEWIFEVIFSSKIRTKYCKDFCPAVWHGSVFWEKQWLLKYIHSVIHWPLQLSIYLFPNWEVWVRLLIVNSVLKEPF